MLWRAETFDSKIPHDLISSMWCLKCCLLVPVAVKSIMECNKMIQLLKNDEGVEFVPFTEGPKKTRQGGL